MDVVVDEGGGERRLTERRGKLYTSRYIAMKNLIITGQTKLETTAILIEDTLNFKSRKQRQEIIIVNRNNQCLLKFPKIKTEYARKSFSFMGAKIYKELPIEIRKNKSFNDFNKRLKEHFA